MNEQKKENIETLANYSNNNDKKDSKVYKLIQNYLNRYILLAVINAILVGIFLIFFFFLLRIISLFKGESFVFNVIFILILPVFIINLYKTYKKLVKIKNQLQW